MRDNFQGLYEPAFERDSCGVGLVCHLKGEPSHDIVHKALQILVNLSHRGACGCDEKTGDGAGILMQMPDKFLRKEAEGLSIRLPPPTEYAVGLVFLPRIRDERHKAQDWLEGALRQNGLVCLGWRDVPSNNRVLGRIALGVEPVMRQVFVGRGPGIHDVETFERKLYVARKVIERAARESDLAERKFFYICSLSSRTLVYKGLMLADQIETFMPDLRDPDLASGMAIVHQRYSTNTFPTWDLAQPFRYLCHNGEINTLRGNVNWMRAREAIFNSPKFGADIAKLLPICTPGASDTAILDNAVELLLHTGRSLPHAILTVIPEAWQHRDDLEDDVKAFYEYHACLMEPWDGPASIPFSDGQCVGAVLDRNGLRPSRYTVTHDGLLVMASETGALEIPPENVKLRGRLQPGRMLLVDMRQGRIVEDEEIKRDLARRRPYRAWVAERLLPFHRVSPAAGAPPALEAPVSTLHNEYGYTYEDLKIILAPMCDKGEEPVGSMGVDVPLAVLSDRPQLVYNYFKQLFAQVTNPPLDAIREELVTSLATYLGAEQNLFEETMEHCHMLRLEQPILADEDLQRIRELDPSEFPSATLPAHFDPAGGGAALTAALDDLCARAETAVRDRGCTLLILSDRGVSRERAPIPMLLACGAVHHHLIRRGLRTRCALIIESAEPREVHHFAALFGYGAAAINPYLALATLHVLKEKGLAQADAALAKKNYVKAVGKGVLKTMSKMGISTLQSYRGAQQFEAVGLNDEVIERCFAGTASRVGGVGFDVLAEEVARRHRRAWPERTIPETLELDVGGVYQWRRGGERHLLQPLAIAKLQQATRDGDEKAFADFCRLVDDQNRELMTLRGLLQFREDPAKAVPLDEVEPWTSIVRRFKTGAMSYGSISQEAHETLAIAMNRLGGKSNSGEGGEDAERYQPLPNGDWKRSAIKQVASGRFGVTIHYLVNAVELQIKMAQGAKPGEGGQLPAEKVYPWIAKTRHSTPYVQLISPPPHHDIYSIEDLAQLIHDLKNANPQARVTVKLVSEVGVGTVAAGVAKGKADLVLISGYDGGTGASPESSLKHAGLPWELGLAETHQTLVLNDLRSRIVVECDGKLLTGRDVAIACLLGAEEFGFSTAPLITLGCVMMRVCHLNTCPVGIATQNPELRKKFAGSPEYVVNFFHFVAEDLRRWMARLGYRTVDEMVGQSHRLEARSAVEHWKARGLDLSRVLAFPEAPPTVGRRCTQKQDHRLEAALDHELLEKTWPALEHGEKVAFGLRIRNVNRTVGTMLSGEIARRYGEAGLPEDTIVIRARGSAGQSFCAFGAPGLTIHVQGDANDYFGKGLSGAKLSIRPPPTAAYLPEENIIIGNVALYGATAGEAYVRGIAGERFAVRNSGAHAVVEGVGDHGCEYMTGGLVVVIGPTGRNFAAGMSGGVAFVYDPQGRFPARCNREMVGLSPLEESEDIRAVRHLLSNHVRHTGSTVAERILRDWPETVRRFVKVMPHDYRRALERLAEERRAAAPREVPAGAP